MKTIALYLFALSLGLEGRAGDKIEAHWFQGVLSIGSVEEMVDVNASAGKKVIFRYCLHSDSGVELEMTVKNVVVWRNHVNPLGISHSRYTHEVHVRIEGDKILVTSTGARRIIEVHDLKTGALISRKVEDIPQ